MKLALPSQYTYKDCVAVLLMVFLLPNVSFSQSFPFELPELPAGKKITIYYNVVVNDPLDPRTTSVIGEHDTVFYAPGRFLLSDDPDTGAELDITLTPAAQFACNSYSGIVYVDSSATSGNNDGTSWTDAFTDLQDALLARVICPGDVDSIFVAEGTYYPTPDPMNQDSSFNIPDGVVVLGGFPSGGGIIDERNWDCNATILSGDIDKDNELTGNSLHVVQTENVSSATVVDGFVITGGNATGGSLPDQAGGGWYNDGSGSGNISNPTIINCAFIENSTSDFGGAMFNNGLSGESSPILINCVFSGNTSLVSGGAIFNQSVFGVSSPEFTNCVFSGNTAVNGGALFNNGAAGVSSPEFTNCVFSGNTADDGEAIYNLGSGGTSAPSIVNSIFNSNSASNDPVFYNEDASPSIQYSLFDVDFITVNHNNSVMDNGNNKFSMDPLFMHAPPASAAPTTAGNFRLMSGSPAIDMGDSGANSQSEDLDGMSRVYSGIIDMGAYEWREYCRQDTVYLDENGEGLITLMNLDLVGELPEPTGCELDTIIDAPAMVGCGDTAVLYTLYLIRNSSSSTPDTLIQCTDTIWVRDTLAPVFDMINMDLTVNEDCMAVMPDLSPYVSDNCALDTVIQSPEVGEPLGVPGSMVMVTLYARDSSGNEDSIMFDFEVIEVAPTVTLNCRGIISPAIHSDGTISVLVVEIAPNATCLDVHDVQVLNEWNNVIWSAENLRNNDFILDGFNLCSYLGKTLDVVITNGLGTCTTVLDLNKNGNLVMTSALQPGIDPAIAEGKINVYCGKVPDPSKYQPTAINPCTGQSFKPQVQPDWVMIEPYTCDTESDTAEVIFRTWEVFDKDGNLATLTDTIVVFRLPKLTPDAFIGTAEDSFYCELVAVPNDGGVLKRYASWKQPVGLHDYELPYAKLRGVTYELPLTVITAELEHASDEGLLDEYLGCVILRQSDGSEVTIGDLVKGLYMDNLLAGMSPAQRGYGFLQSIIDGNETPETVSTGMGSFTFYPYLLLQSGDQVLSEDGGFEQVDADWFYSGHGNSPYWFSGGWPSIYGNGDCVSYCDVGVGPQDAWGGCILIQVPSLSSEGFSTSECDTICLPSAGHEVNLTAGGIHCGIAIERDVTAGWQGDCPQTRGVDTKITQTCWAETPNFCAGDGTADELDLVASYDSTSKRIEIALSQWQTLIDTLGPIFEFCYPEGWDQTGVQASIRNGEQYGEALSWERSNPTRYRVGESNCEAEVYVPAVELIDNCSGIHSVKAMMDVRGGTRAVELELTSTRTKVLANGDTCTIYTYSHATDPIRIPFTECEGVLNEVRYEAADNCWNQSRWTKFIEITDDVPPTVVVNRNLNVTLTNKIAWARATSFDEGSWDNCAIGLRLGRRTDWSSDAAMVNLCDGNRPHAPYDNWIDLLDDLGVDRTQATTAVTGGQVSMAAFNAKYNVNDLSTILNDGAVERYYYKQIEWLWEDEEFCGEKVVHGWLYSIAAYIAENCSAEDEHGNALRVSDLEAIFDRLTGTPGYGQEMVYLGGGWTKEVPFKCGDACEEVPVELLVMDQCCNFGIGRTGVQVDDESAVKLVKRLPDLTVSCEAYNGFYKDIVAQAAALGEQGSSVDEGGAFAALDSVFGRYIPTWVDDQNRPTDIDGNLLPNSALYFDYHSISCGEKSETEKVAVEGHDGQIDWVNQVTQTTYLDTTDLTGMNGVVQINCAADLIQDVWVDLDECGQGTLTRRFFITGGCGTGTPELVLEQVIRIESACGLRASMFDLPEDMGTKDDPICLPESLTKEYLPDTIGAAAVKSHLDDALCASIAIGKTVKAYDVETSHGLSLQKYLITWSMVDWCADHTSSTRELTHVQTVIATIDPSCEVDGGSGSGDVSLITGHIMTELNSPVKGIDVKAVLGSGSPLEVSTSEDGSFSLTVDQGSSVSIVPYKNTDFSAGVSTADLIDMQRHILQKKRLDSKYQRIAADVNGNGLIDGLDLLELRKVVLNPSRVFANNTSWRFYDTATGQEVFDLEDVSEDHHVEFTGVKIGDVNLSLSRQNVGSDPASPDSYRGRSKKGQLHLNVADKVLKGGEVYRIEVRSDNFEAIRGMQYTLDYADAYVSVESMESGVLNITGDNYLKYAPGVVTASWNAAEGVSAAADEVLFTIVVKAKSAAHLRDVLSVSNRVTATEAYTSAGEYKDIGLHFNGTDAGFALYQNTPNPYTGETVIGFKLPEATSAVMTIYDVNGRLIKRMAGDYEAGYHEVRVTSMELGVTGVLYYQLDTDKYTATKKMVLIK
ncbi:T9SS type A sorting domain-containing protein [Membranicola marinus]|uniref:T9SS type A sorting domain-containing protein n=1 Tax=Membranihabitans marinus TaxID=1227546 RepID=A0A953HR77_9BACT|nr:choice-of-anchor Q domain-containing protein [Membranihabitans marinus]MBY5956811.1 T9SS type A sorting domain-containing protein [Membranihabitans marinus]